MMESADECVVGMVTKRDILQAVASMGRALLGPLRDDLEDSRP